MSLDGSGPVHQGPSQSPISRVIGENILVLIRTSSSCVGQLQGQLHLENFRERQSTRDLNVPCYFVYSARWTPTRVKDPWLITRSAYVVYTSTCMRFRRPPNTSLINVGSPHSLKKFCWLVSAWHASPLLGRLGIVDIAPPLGFLPGGNCSESKFKIHKAYVRGMAVRYNRLKVRTRSNETGRNRWPCGPPIHHGHHALYQSVPISINQIRSLPVSPFL